MFGVQNLSQLLFAPAERPQRGVLHDIRKPAKARLNLV